MCFDNLTIQNTWQGLLIIILLLKITEYIATFKTDNIWCFATLMLHMEAGDRTNNSANLNIYQTSLNLIFFYVAACVYVFCQTQV